MYFSAFLIDSRKGLVHPCILFSLSLQMNNLVCPLGGKGEQGSRAGFRASEDLGQTHGANFWCKLLMHFFVQRQISSAFVGAVAHF